MQGIRNITVNISIPVAAWRKHIPKLCTWTRGLVQPLLEEGQACNICFANDDMIQDLNKQFRRKDKPTNVLSFPQDEEIDGVNFIGDIIVSRETIARESTAQGKPFINHTAHMLVHGVLHLHGFDHKTDAQAAMMEQLEIEHLKLFDILNPYDVSFK